MTKITFLTGAGASFGGGNVSPYNPPLGRDLYQDLELQAPSIMNQINSIVGRKNIYDFEAKMDEIWKNGRINGFTLNSLLARYFARFSPSFSNNRFIDLTRILHENSPLDCVYSTLNYDCIAELAASRVGMRVNYNLDTFDLNSFNVLKLHGSCNFINDSMQGRGTISSGVLRGTVDGGAIKIVQPNEVDQILQVRPLGPVMAFYMKNKPTQTNKSVLDKIQNFWKDRMSKSNKVIIIGINPNPDDKHIWETISKTNAKIGFVGRDPSFKKLKKIGTKKTPKKLEEDFASSISEIENFII